MKLIDKSALVAEIEKHYNECLKRAKIVDSDYWSSKADAYRNVLVILNDTIEVKEVDLEKENLTWQDVGFINEIVNIILGECEDKILYGTEEEFCKEVLRRFKAQKGE